MLAVRDAHPAWGARKIARCLEREGLAAGAFDGARDSAPARPDRCAAGRRSGSPALREAGAQSALADGLQGHMPLAGGGRCHPLTVVDDHSRYDLCLAACADERRSTVQEPSGTDLPPLWPAGGLLRRQRQALGRFVRPALDQVRACGCSSSASTSCTAGPTIRRAAARTSASIARSTPRCSRSARFRDLAEVQRAFDRWRTVYNLERPHQALDQDVPASRYRPSPRSMPDRLPEVEYDGHEIVRIVPTTKDYISFKGRPWIVPRAFRGERVAIRPLDIRRPIRRLLRRPPDRNYRLDQQQNVSVMSPNRCRSCPRAEHLCRASTSCLATHHQERRGWPGQARP